MSARHRRCGSALGACLVLVASTVLLTGCELGGPGTPQILAGPTVPSPIPVQAPYIWEGERGLEVWRRNAVSRGPLTLVGVGEAAAFLRVDPATAEWVLRGPDLEPPARGVRTVRIRYRWVPDPRLDPAASLTLSLRALFERVPPVPDQPTADADLTPATAWTDFDFLAGNLVTAIRYVYLHSAGANRGVFDISRIELVL